MADVCMSGKKAVSEHKNLVQVLRSGNKKELKAEARDQSKELKSYRKTARKSGRS
jgi:hypothetical protein